MYLIIFAVIQNNIIKQLKCKEDMLNGISFEGSVISKLLKECDNEFKSLFNGAVVSWNNYSLLLITPDALESMVNKMVETAVWSSFEV